MVWNWDRWPSAARIEDATTRGHLATKSPMASLPTNLRCPLWGFRIKHSNQWQPRRGNGTHARDKPACSEAITLVIGLGAYLHPDLNWNAKKQLILNQSWLPISPCRQSLAAKLQLAAPLGERIRAIGEYRTLGIHNHNVALYH